MDNDPVKDMLGYDGYELQARQKRDANEPTLRDRFAMAALQGYLAGEHFKVAVKDERVQNICGLMAEHAYEQADAMLKERAK